MVNLSYISNQFTIIQFNGQYIYEEDASSSELEKHFDGDNIIPGNSVQGEISFQIHKDAKDLKVRFEYSYESSGVLKLEFFKLDR